MGGNGNLEGVAKRFVSSFLRAVPTSLTMFGGGTWEGGSCEERNADFAGETRISLEWGLEAGGLGGYSHHPMVVTTLALECCVKVRALP